MGPLSFSRFQPQHLDAYIRAIVHAFGSDPAEVAPWLARAGEEHLRVVHRDGAFAGGLIRIPMGQFFLGRSIPMIGIAGVAVPPEQRGRGAATFLMEETLREMHEEGAVLSALYASTPPLYRKAGYETAGCLWSARVPIEALDPIRGGEVRELEDRDREAVEALYREHARSMHGWLDRGPYIWHRIRHPRTEPAFGFGFEQEGTLTGYLYLARRKPPGRERHDVLLLDYCATTREAQDALIALVRAEFAMGQDLTFAGGVTHPIATAISERRLEVTLREAWLLRIVDVERALAARPFPHGVRAAIAIRVDDPAIGENRGAFTLEIEGGTARIRRGGEPEIALSIGALASLYSGHATAESLALSGRAAGDPSALRTATEAFRAPAPEMVDFF